MNNSEKSFRKFLLLWSGEIISAIGRGLTSFGLGVYVFQQTGKASASVRAVAEERDFSLLSLVRCYVLPQ